MDGPLCALALITSNNMYICICGNRSHGPAVTNDSFFCIISVKSESISININNVSFAYHCDNNLSGACFKNIVTLMSLSLCAYLPSIPPTYLHMAYDFVCAS